MRTLLFLGWLMVPVAFGAYHYGPGQERLKLDDTSRVLADADRLAAGGRAAEAVAAYSQALALLPKDRTREAYRIRLERSKAQMFARQLPEAHAELSALVEELDADPAAGASLVADARECLASARYYMTWLMRLEGLGREEWDPEIEGARQTYRLLAEQAEARGDRVAADRHRENLESAIRLARMEPGELQGLSLPSQCQGCKSGQCKGKKPGRKPGGQKKAEDARGASSGPPPDSSGS